MGCCWSLFLWVGIPLAIFKIYFKLTTGWCRSQVCLKGKTALVTGANTGIGYETALDLAKRGARVILGCRDESKAKEACDRIKAETHNDDVVYKLVDLSSFKSVRKFAEEIISSEKQLDILVNNAGLGGTGDGISEDGLLEIMQINYFSPFLLTLLLLDLLKKSSSRIVNVASVVAKYAKLDIDNLNEFKGHTAQYNISKLCNVLFTIELASRLKHTKVTTYSVHPGIVKTDIFRRMPPLMKATVDFFVGNLFKSATEGAQTSIYLAVANDIEFYNGENFHDCKLKSRYKTANDDRLRKQLWKKSEEIVKLSYPPTEQKKD